MPLAETTALVFLTPLLVALLLALLYSLTNHARHHEITAIRAAGISIWRLALPYFGVGLVSSLALLALNELWVPDSSDRAEQIKERHVPPPPGAPGRDQVLKLGFTNAREGRLWQIPVYNLESGEMFNPQVIWAQRDGTRLWIRAERGWWTNGVWVFAKVRLDREPAQTNSLLVPVLQTNVMAFPEFSETPEQIRSEMKISQGISLRGARKADIPVAAILNYLRLHPNPSASDAAWLPSARSTLHWARSRTTKAEARAAGSAARNSRRPATSGPWRACTS